MKTFKQFINESKAFDIEQLKNDCAFYLSKIKGTAGESLLYRGGKDWPDDFAIRTWKQRERPRDTPTEAHNVFNEYFKKQYGQEFRNWMFCTGDPSQAKVYSGMGGSITCIFPIGKFEWFCGFDFNLRDLTQWTKSEAYKIEDADVEKRIPYGERYKLAAQSVIKQIHPNTWKYNSNLIACIKSENEIMFKCDKYYAFNFDGPTFKSKEFQQFLRSI